MIGVEEDKRDYFGAIKLMKNYLHQDNEVDLLVGNTSFDKLAKEFFKNNVKVRKYIKLSNESEKQGIHSIEQRIKSIKHDVENLTKTLDIKNLQRVCQQIS